jgi:hypothetical protein
MHDTKHFPLLAKGSNRRVYEFDKDHVLKVGLVSANQNEVRLHKLFPDDVPETTPVDSGYTQIIQQKVTPLFVGHPLTYTPEYKARFEYLAARYRDRDVKPSNLGLMDDRIVIFDAGAGREDKMTVETSRRKELESEGWRIVGTESHPSTGLRLKMAKIY